MKNPKSSHSRLILPPKTSSTSKSTVLKRTTLPSPRERKKTEEVISFKPQGLSLGLKYAILTVVVIIFALSILVVVAYSSVRQQVDEEINQAGIMLIKVLSSFDVEYWNTLKEQEPEKNPLARMVSQEATKMGIHMPTIINLGITTKGGTEWIVAIQPVDVSLSGERTLKLTTDQIKITEGYYTASGTKNKIRTRRYTKPIKYASGHDSGYEVNLWLSAHAIDYVLNKLFTAFLVPAIIAILVGLFIGFWMATYVTRPLKRLMNDMEIVSKGHLDYQTQIKSKDEIGVLAEVFNRMTRGLKTVHELELAAKAVEHELNIAHEIQANLLPQKIPILKGYDVYAFYRASKEVGGDYYDIIPVDDDNIGVVVADVSGKGIPGSLVMTMTRSLIRMEAVRTLSPAETLSKVNRVLAADVRRGMFVTVLYFILNIRNHTILVSSAGHNPLILWRKSKHTYELINPNGIALGFDRGPVFERTIKEQLVQLSLGDRLVAYTDGIVEAMNSHKETFGTERFYKLIAHLAENDSQQFINSTIKVLDNFQNPELQHDDITLVSIRFTG